MQKSLLILAALGIAAAPAFAQTTPPPASDQTAAAAKPKTVTKIVCERVRDEETTGSRVGSAPKVCKRVEVPADSAEAQKGKQASSPETQQGH
jgi:hypothetical protein